MELKHRDLAVAPTFGSIVSQLVIIALGRAALVLVACMAVGFFSDAGTRPYLCAAGLGFGLVGSFNTVRAERSSAPPDAANLYSVAFINYAIASAAFFAAGLMRTNTSLMAFQALRR
jgi:hypothetical protein